MPKTVQASIVGIGIAFALTAAASAAQPAQNSQAMPYQAQQMSGQGMMPQMGQMQPMMTPEMSRGMQMMDGCRQMMSRMGRTTNRQTRR